MRGIERRGTDLRRARRLVPRMFGKRFTILSDEIVVGCAEGGFTCKRHEGIEALDPE
jgi:hypothetical protein